jgi:hypothetical protein
MMIVELTPGQEAGGGSCWFGQTRDGVRVKLAWDAVGDPTRGFAPNSFALYLNEYHQATLFERRGGFRQPNYLTGTRSDTLYRAETMEDGRVRLTGEKVSVGTEEGQEALYWASRQNRDALGRIVTDVGGIRFGS